MGQRHWHRRPLRVFLLYSFIGLLALLNTHIPSPGKAVAALGVAAATMTILGAMRGGEKLAWILILFGFLGTEFTSIDNERSAHEQEQQATRAEQLRHFNEIADGIKDNLSAVTGNGSFLEIGPVPNMGAGNPPTYPLVVEVVGKYPMRSVVAQIQKVELKRDPESIKKQFLSMHNLPTGDTILPGAHLIDERIGLGKYAIGIWSVSGLLNEELDLKLGDQRELLASYQVMGNGKILVKVTNGKLILRRAVGP
jgi:hypothetical protein